MIRDKSTEGKHMRGCWKCMQSMKSYGTILRGARERKEVSNDEKSSCWPRICFVDQESPLENKRRCFERVCRKWYTPDVGDGVHLSGQQWITQNIRCTPHPIRPQEQNRSQTHTEATPPKDPCTLGHCFRRASKSSQDFEGNDSKLPLYCMT